VSMPFYVSPEQLMRDKADYARKGVARSRSSVVLQYAGGILMVTPNVSSVLHKISELYDRIAFAAVGRYNEYETLRKAGVTYADVTGYQFDRGDVTARGVANWYAQTLGGIATDSSKPYEVEIVVAEVGTQPDSDQIYRITWDGSVSDEPGFVAFGGQADQVAALLKERFSDGMSLTEALGAALDALAAPSAGSSSPSAASNGEPAGLNAAQLEVAILDRARAHRTFRRLRGPRLEELLAEGRAASAAATPSAPDDAGSGPAAGSGSGTGSAPGSRQKSAPPSDEPPTGPAPGSKDGIPKPPPAKLCDASVPIAHSARSIRPKCAFGTLILRGRAAGAAGRPAVPRG
jgi:proteasome alpha subunit